MVQSGTPTKDCFTIKTYLYQHIMIQSQSFNKLFTYFQQIAAVAQSNCSNEKIFKSSVIVAVCYDDVYTVPFAIQLKVSIV